MPSIFISYKRHHEASDRIVRALELALKEAFDVWRDQSIEPGKAWSKELYGCLLGCDAAIAIVTEEANKADWCRREWSVLVARQQVADVLVIPIHIGDHIIQTGILDDAQGILWSEELVPQLFKQLSAVAARTFSPKDFLAAHQAWLRWQYREENVLGQEPYSLSDVYIDTECGELPWKDINEQRGIGKNDPFKEASGGRKNLLEAVLSKMGDNDFRDLIVVQAGPGSGKSAFTVRLANALMGRGFTPIVVRFRDLRLATFPAIPELLDDAIRIGSTDEESPNPPGAIVADMLAEKAILGGTTLCRAVFILDGWDEVSLTGNVTYQAQLKEWLPRLREYFVGTRTPRVRLILTGRPSSEVGESGALHAQTPVFTIRPMRPEQLRSYASTIEAHLEAAAMPAWKIDVAKLEPMFNSYAGWFEQYVKGNDSSHSASGDVLGNPLLAYLSLRVIAESERDPEALLSEPTALFNELIETTVRNAGRGTDAKLDGTAHRGGEGLRQLLQEVATVITILRNESVSYTELQLRFEDEDLPIERGQLENWAGTADARNALRELVINFYFKGGHKGLGCEFLHKSFREYLFAEAVIGALQSARTDELPTQYATLKYWEDFPQGSAAHTLSRRLSYLLAPQWMTPEIETHIVWLLREGIGRDSEKWTRMRDLVTEVYAWWAEGVHVRPQPARGRSSGKRWEEPFVDRLFRQTMPLDADASTPPVRCTILDAHLGQALMRLGCVLHELLSRAAAPPVGRRGNYQSFDEGSVRFKPGGGRFLRALMARIQAEGWGDIRFGSVITGAVDLRQEDLSVISGGFGKLSGAVCSHAILGGADLTLAHLDSTQFDGAYLVGAQMSGAFLRAAVLERADLRSANLAMAIAMGARFQLANLQRAHLGRANLIQANFDGADLRNANWDAAEVAGASFHDAKLTRVEFARARNTDKIRGTPIFVDDPKETKAHTAAREADTHDDPRRTPTP